MTALRERPERRPARKKVDEVARRIREIQAELARLPVLDPRSPDEIIGYDERGLPI